MNLISSYCNSILNALGSMSKDVNLVLAHESGIKHVPVGKPYAAIGIKKCSVSSPIVQKNEDGADITDGTRKILITASINIYAPYKNGGLSCVKIYENIFDHIFNSSILGFVETKFLGTKYSRETQSIVAETEFVFECFLSDSEFIEPIVPGE